MPFCRICLFALACCACTAQARQRAAKTAPDIAACVLEVVDAYATADVENPDVALALAADLARCERDAKDDLTH